MFGQANPRWPTATTLVLMVAFFGIHLTSGLYLPSPVTDMPDDSDYFTDMISAQPDYFHDNATPNPDVECVFIRHRDDLKACIDKAKKKDFANITDECSNAFALAKCVMETLCQFCSGLDKLDKCLNEGNKLLNDPKNDELREQECNKWKSKDPMVPTIVYSSGPNEQRPESYYKTIALGTYAALIVVWELIAIAFWLANRNR